jgi:hypothetical protein
LNRLGWQLVSEWRKKFELLNGNGDRRFFFLVFLFLFKFPSHTGAIWVGVRGGWNVIFNPFSIALPLSIFEFFTDRKSNVFQLAHSRSVLRYEKKMKVRLFFYWFIWIKIFSEEKRVQSIGGSLCDVSTVDVLRISFVTLNDDMGEARRWDTKCVTRGSFWALLMW